MNLTPVQNNSAADVPIEQLAGNRVLTQQQKVAEVARQFEALLLRQILSETQKTVIPSTYTDDSTAAGIYHDMVTQQLADSISKSGTLGLAQSLERQLTQQLQPASTAGSDRTANTKSRLPLETGMVRPLLSQKLEPLQVTGEENSHTYRTKNNLRHPLQVASLSTPTPLK
jgi:peptidoglycan hydrolase FlgJ